MRCFKTTDGHVLVEGPARPCDLALDDGTVLSAEHPYWLLGADGRVEQVFDATPYSVQEHWGTVLYAVVGAELRCYVTDVNSELPEEPRRTNVSTRVAGLELLAAGEGPTEAALRAALEDYRALARTSAARDAQSDTERMASFRRALPDYPGEGALGFVFGYEPAPPGSSRPVMTVARRGGPVLWREADYPWWGKDLYRDLHDALRARYGDRLAAFDLDLPPEHWLDFDPD